jgi:hypothetical protein
MIISITASIASLLIVLAVGHLGRVLRREHHRVDLGGLAVRRTSS